MKINNEESRRAREREEAELFLCAMTGIRRSPPPSHVHAAAATPSTRPFFREADERAVMQELLYGPFEPDTADDVDALRYRTSGVRDRVWRRLARGAYHVDAELDLHGLNRERAYVAVHEFLGECGRRDRRCIRIIHGKGLRSPGNGPVIRRLLGSWLRRRRDVLAFCLAQPKDGGSGATYVLLRRVTAEFR
ncbi:MAG TPA: Smr/MutS family protein [Nevskiaceae bacterium]